MSLDKSSSFHNDGGRNEDSQNCIIKPTTMLTTMDHFEELNELLHMFWTSTSAEPSMQFWMSVWRDSLKKRMSWRTSRTTCRPVDQAR
jgi:hypothetical protein